MTEWDRLYGHQWAVDLLKNSIRYNRIGHAYLITGPSKIGKTTLATLFAQALNCLAEPTDQRPCGLCRPCTLIRTQRHPDVRLVTGEATTRGTIILKIDQIRRLQQELNLTAAEARYKVAILKQFETANPSAANAFLKTLEEPPGNVILILTALDADSLLPTISSRCRNITLRLLPFLTIRQALRDRFDMAKGRAELLAHVSGGRIGWAFDAAENQSLLNTREVGMSFLVSAFERNRVSRFNLADELARSNEELPELLRIWISWWRDLTLISFGQTDRLAITNIDQLESLIELASIWPKGRILSGLKGTEQALWQLLHNANTRLVMENLLLSYPKLVGEPIVSQSVT